MIKYTIPYMLGEQLIHNVDIKTIRNINPIQHYCFVKRMDWNFRKWKLLKMV